MTAAWLAAASLPVAAIIETLNRPGYREGAQPRELWRCAARELSRTIHRLDRRSVDRAARSDHRVAPVRSGSRGRNQRRHLGARSRRIRLERTIAEGSAASVLGEPTLLPLSAIRTPNYAPKLEPGSRLVILGATVDISFNAPSIDDRVLPVRMMLDGTEVARAQVDFSRFE
jgi:hypothetical protein